MIDWKTLAEDARRTARHLPRDVAAAVERLSAPEQVVWYSAYDTARETGEDSKNAAVRAWKTLRFWTELQQRQPTRSRIVVQDGDGEPRVTLSELHSRRKDTEMKTFVDRALPRQIDGDPREQLDALAKARARAKGIDFLQALREVKVERPELVEQVAGFYSGV